MSHRQQPDTPEEEVMARRAQATSAAAMSYTGTNEATMRKFEENAGARYDLARIQRKRKEAEGRRQY